MAEMREDSNFTAPLLSVVVPIYNTEKYLDECLQSILAQNVTDFEVIMVDDGSTDGSGEIAESWERRDRRFRLFRQSNRGVGHARNTGVAHIRGSYLAFVDSDDKINVDAYRMVIETLERTGSDFATGNVHRFDSTGHSWQAPLYRGMARSEKLTTHVSRSRELLRDHLAHNKVWRSSFWREKELRFPEDVLYEDVPCVIPAHVQAKSVDVLPVVVVLWRVRDMGNSSITQNRHREARHLVDRVQGMLTASSYLAEHATSDLKDDYDQLVLRRDLRWYIDMYPDVDASYQAEIISWVGRFRAQVSSEALRRTPAAVRVACALSEGGTKRQFEEFVRLRRSGQIDEVRVAIRGGRAVLDIDIVQTANLPDDVLDVTDELNLASRVSQVDAQDGDLTIAGWAYIDRLPITEDAGQAISVWLDGDGEKVSANVTYRRDERAATDAGAYNEAGGRIAFTARISLRKLRRRWSCGFTTWTVHVAVTNAGITCTGPLAKPLMGRAERPVMVRLRGNDWLRVCWRDGVLTGRVRTEAATVYALRVDGEAFHLTVRTNEPVAPEAQLRLAHSTNRAGHIIRVVRDQRDERLGHARIAPAELRVSVDEGSDGTSDLVASASWDLNYRPSKAARWQRVLDPDGAVGHSVSDGENETVVRRTSAATVRIARLPMAPLLTGAEWRNGATLVLRMSYGGSAPVENILLTARKQTESIAFPVVRGDDNIAELTVETLPRFGESVPIRAGVWDVQARTRSGVVPLRIAPGMAQSLPLATSARERKYSLTDRNVTGLSLIVEDDCTSPERRSVD